MSNLRLIRALLFLIMLVFIVQTGGCISAQRAARQTSAVEISPPTSSERKKESVILLHGLNRTSRSMRPMAEALSAEGYRVCSIGYPSRYFSVEALARNYVLPKITQCLNKQNGEQIRTVHFVTHSLGGILVRELDEELKAYPTGRLVMLSPPNHGSEAVDKLNNNWAFQQIAGPAGNELGTTPESLPQTLPAPSMPFAVIAAKHSNSAMSFLIPGDDDGKVSIENMQLEEMTDFVRVDSTHSFMMRNAQTIKYVLEFFRNGMFTHD